MIRRLIAWFKRLDAEHSELVDDPGYERFW